MKDVEKMKRRIVYDAIVQSARKNFDKLFSMTDEEFDKDNRRFMEEMLYWIQQLDPSIKSFRDYEDFKKLIKLWNELVKEFEK